MIHIVLENWCMLKEEKKTSGFQISDHRQLLENRLKIAKALRVYLAINLVADIEFEERKRKA